ncbi:hypothetical protein niasHS_015197 [Heterodera schachtii]|uniref:G-protein coupled receptors family 1 profile domain-containing protein n=1 Tax=Heterodera schachtii TaxID=97005 RepID=A0ABD2I5N3_HETSC
MENQTNDSENSFTEAQLALLRTSIFVFSVTKSVLCLIGILLNLSLIYVTVRAKWLHGICNIFLLIYDASVIPFLAGVPFYLNQFVQGYPSMKVSECLMFQFVPLFLFCGSFPLMLFIAIDRLIGAVFPIKYRSVKKWSAVGIALVLCALYSFCYMIIALQNALRAQLPIACTTTAPLGSAVNALAKTNFALESIAIFIYIFIWLHMNKMDKKSRKENGNSIVDVRRLFKSLFSILLVDFVGWSTNSISITLLDLIGFSSASPKATDRIIYFFITSSLNYMTYISACSNSIVLYSLNQDYQRAFDQFLPNWMVKLKNALCRKHNTLVVPNNGIIGK